jgi:YidC/Oxa1 family membrane protein insertase
MYHNYIYVPLYNGLVALINFLPMWAGVGMAIVVFTILVKLVLFPLSKTTLKTQLRMKEIEPKMKTLREKYKGKTQELSQAMMQLYKDEKVNPFSSMIGLVLVIVQFPILFALYRIFYSGGLPNVHPELLYSFVHAPAHALNMTFFGINIATKSIIFALLAGLAQFFQMKYSFAQMAPATTAVVDPSKKPAMGDMMVTMQKQMKYTFPILMVLIAYSVNSAIALYLITSSLFALGQEVVMRRSLRKKI